MASFLRTLHMKPSKLRARPQTPTSKPVTESCLVENGIVRRRPTMSGVRGADGISATARNAGHTPTCLCCDSATVGPPFLRMSSSVSGSSSEAAKVGATRVAASAKASSFFILGLLVDCLGDIICYSAEICKRQETVTFFMTTGSSGTFWCGPQNPVFTLAIASTTSMPSVTRPKTA